MATPETEKSQGDYAAYEADADLTANSDAENILARITTLAAEWREADAGVQLREKELKEAQERRRMLEEVLLPGAMDEAQQVRLTTTDGYDVERTETLRAAISQDNMPRAAAWLKANGQASIIKQEVKVDFGKGEEQKAAEAVDALREHGFEPSSKLGVNPMTLGAAVREMMENGVELSSDVQAMLGVYVQAKVKIKAAKAKNLPKKK